MSKRILSMILSAALLLGAVGVTGILSVSAADELTADGKVIATYEPVTKAADIPTDTQLNQGKLAFRYDYAAGYNLRSGGNKDLRKSMNETDPNDWPNTNNVNSGVKWPGQTKADVIGKMADGVYLTGYAETAEAETNGTANIPIPWKSGTYWETDENGSTISDRSQTTYAGWANSDDSQYMVYDLGAVSQVTKIGIGSGVERPAFSAANAPQTEAELQALMGQTKNASQALTKVSVYVGSDLANLFGTPIKGSDGKTTLSGNTYRVLTYDFSGDKEKALANIFTLTAEATGRYVGFHFHYNGTPYINELAVYGEQRTTALTTGNADVLAQLGVNRLSTAERLTGALASGSGAWSCLTDGVIYGVTTTDESYKSAKCGIVVSGDDKNPITGETITGVTGWGSLVFRLEEETTLTHVLMAGSAGDTGNNRYVRFYEFYAADSREELFQEAHRILRYDNTSAPQLALLHKLAASVTCTYVGVRFTGEQYNQSRISELAVYGTVATPEPKPLGDSYGTKYQPIREIADIPQRVSLIAGMEPVNTGVKEGTKSAVTDGQLAGVHMRPSYITTTTDTGDAVPGETGLYFDYSNNYVKTNVNDYRTVFYTGETRGNLQLDVLQPLTFDLGGVCAVDALVIGSETDLPSWKKGQAPKTVEEYVAKQNGYSTDSLLMKGEVYIGDSLETLYDAANRVMYYDWSNAADRSKARNNLFVLGEAKTGRYVGFKFNSYWNLLRVGELAVYGTKSEDPSGVIQLTESNVNELKKLGENRLFGADTLTGTLANGSGAWSCLSDGEIYGITTKSDAYKYSKCGIAVGTNKTNPITGEEIPGISGWGSASFQLMGEATLTHVLMAGSFADEGNNRYVRFYEFYASMTASDLFRTENRIVCYDNTQDPQLAQLHALEKAVTCRFVGVRFTGEAYSQSRISEIGLYGDMEIPESLPYTRLNSQTDYTATLANKGDNLLKGERVGNKTKDYLLCNGVAISKGDEAWLTNDYINWTSADREEKVEINTSSGNQFYYDLRGRVALDSVLVASSGKDTAAYRPDRISVYMSDDEETLFSDSSLVGQALTGGTSVAVLIDLSAKNASGRYIGFSIPGDSQYKMLRLTELGVYGTYTGEPTAIPVNLLAQDGSKRVDHFQVDARGIDNVTAVGANSNPGKNTNTGAMPSKRAVSTFEELDNLTDGDLTTRSANSVTTNSEAINAQILNYDNSWLGFTYYLGGASKLDEVSLVSSNEPGYYVTGVQIYAAYYYKDLFKNETLLYTSGGEHYTGSEADGYLPDINYELYKRELKYTLTEEQRAQEYRYIAFVVTRAFPLYWPGTTNYCIGYGMARIAELTAYGEITTPEPPLNNTWEADTRFGKATVTIEPDNYDDREFCLQIDHVTIDEEPLPAGVQRNVNNNWLTVVGDTLFHLRFWDAKGKQVNDTNNKRDVMVVLSIDHQYNYTAGIIRDGQIQRLYNAFVRPDNTLRLGEINYPVYPETTKNNRDKATFQEMDASLVLLQWNDPRTVDALDGNVHYGSVTEFFGTAVAGASAQQTAASVSLWWLLVPAALAAAGVTGVLLLRRRKRGAAEQ